MDKEYIKVEFEPWLLSIVGKSVVVRAMLYLSDGKANEICIDVVTRDERSGDLFCLWMNYLPLQQQSCPSMGLILLDPPDTNDDLRCFLTRWGNRGLEGFAAKEQAIAIRSTRGQSEIGGALSPELLTAYGVFLSEVRNSLNWGSGWVRDRPQYLSTVLNRLPGFLHEQFRKFNNAKSEAQRALSLM